LLQPYLNSNPELGHRKAQTLSTEEAESTVTN
jgi:hypothetical protein